MKNNFDSVFNVSEIFYSIQGEGTRAGMPCVFVRLQGCRLRCEWCDTKYALEFGQQEVEMTGDDIIQKVESYQCKFVEFTGGEPLEQPEIKPLMSYFCDNGYTVAVETSGYIDISDLDKRIIKILDVKCPGSKMDNKNKYENLNFLGKYDEVKFVMTDKTDYEFAKYIAAKYDLTNRTAAVLFAPVFGKIDYKEFAEWILQDKLNVRMQLQLHKYIWEQDKRGV
jgi:7-carboxy-7-deazaguanine synthase